MKKFPLFIFIVAIAGAVFWGYKYFHKITIISDNQNESNPVLVSKGDTVRSGAITQNQDGTNAYVNSHYKFSFTFPKGWHVGDRSLDGNTLQLFNYDESVYKKNFVVGENKIEASVSLINTYGTSSDYPEMKRKQRQIIIAGQNAVVYDIELVDGRKIRSYFVPIHYPLGNYFGMTMYGYGDEINFGVIDAIMESFRFF